MSRARRTKQPDSNALGHGDPGATSAVAGSTSTPCSKDTAAGQAWACAGCLLARRRLQLRDQLAALTAMIDAEMCRAEDATLAPDEREEARNPARGIATALNVMTGG